MGPSPRCRRCSLLPRAPLLRLFLMAHLAVAGSGGCKGKQLQKDEDLLVAEDRRIAQREDQLLARRGNLQRERGTLREKREELLSKKMSLEETDTAARAVIEKEESQLKNLEENLLKQEINLNEKLQSLFDEKSGLVDKLGKAGGKDVLVARREYGVALREKDLARREADLGRRERLLAEREKNLAERQAKGCPRVTTVMLPPPPTSGGGGGGTTRKEVEPVYRAALAAMQSKGILTADLPPGIDRLVTEVRHGVGKGDYVRAKYAADQLLATVRGMKVDRSFIGAKISRLGGAIRTSPPSADKRDRVQGLFQQATAAYGDGRFAEANRLLNRIYNLIH